jgi:uncharacterized integral membrane protein
MSAGSKGDTSPEANGADGSSQPTSAPKRKGVPRQRPSDSAAAVETRGERFRRKAHRIGLYLYAFFIVALLVCLVALAVANTDKVEFSWVVGSARVSLVWIVIFAAILGWLLGIVTGVVFRWRTRARHRHGRTSSGGGQPSRP